MSSVVISGDTSGAITLAAPAVAGTNTITLPAGTGTVAVQGASTNIVSGTSQASTSGTSIDFTGIPSWVKRITVMFNGVSTSGSSNIQLQVGSGSVTTTGYNGSASYQTGVTSQQGSSSSGLVVVGSVGASYLFGGSAILTLLGSNIWCMTSNLSTTSASPSSVIYSASSTIALSGTLDRVRITTVNGTDTFDAGSINILYE